MTSRHPLVTNFIWNLEESECYFFDMPDLRATLLLKERYSEVALALRSLDDQPLFESKRTHKIPFHVPLCSPSSPSSAGRSETRPFKMGNMGMLALVPCFQQSTSYHPEAAGLKDPRNHQHETKNIACAALHTFAGSPHTILHDIPMYCTKYCAYALTSSHSGVPAT